MSIRTAGMIQRGPGESCSQAPLGWNRKRVHYECWDGKRIEIVHRTAGIRDLGETKTVPRNVVEYLNKRSAWATVSGVEFSRSMDTVLGGPDDIRTMIFPNMVKIVRQGAFYCVKSLQSVVLNEGLEVLGTDEYQPDGMWYSGVFQESGLRRVRLPSTLRRIEYDVFEACKHLERVDLPDGLEYVGKKSFRASALGSVRFPPGLKTIDDCAFAACKELRSVKFAEGLEQIGALAFFESGLEHVELPVSLRMVAHGAFACCESLSSAQFCDGLEVLGTDDCPDSGGLFYGVFSESALR